MYSLEDVYLDVKPTNCAERPYNGRIIERIGKRRGSRKGRMGIRGITQTKQNKKGERDCTDVVLALMNRAMGWSLLSYAAPIWTSFVSNTQWRLLQTTQNNALGIAIGWVKVASIDHFQEKSKMRTVRKNNELVTKQYLIAYFPTSHSNHHTIMNNAFPRRKRLDFINNKSEIIHLIPKIVDLGSEERHKTPFIRRHLWQPETNLATTQS